MNGAAALNITVTVFAPAAAALMLVDCPGVQSADRRDLHPLAGRVGKPAWTIPCPMPTA